MKNKRYKCPIKGCSFSGYFKCKFCTRKICYVHSEKSVTEHGYTCSECITPSKNPPPITALSYSRMGKKKAAPSPLYVAYQKLDEIKEEFVIYIDPDVFIRMAGMFIDNPSKEIAGVAVLNDDTVVWSEAAEIESSSGAEVRSNSGQATVNAMLAGFGVPNLQWHTHPGMGVFFSHTDVVDQMEFAIDAAKMSPDGEHLFLVFDQLSWAICKIIWKDGVPVSTQDGVVKLKSSTGDITMKIARKRYTHTISNSTYSKYKNNGTMPDYYSQIYGTQQPYTTPPKQGDGKEYDVYTYEDWIARNNVVALPATTEVDHITSITEGVGHILRGNWSDKDSDYDFLFGLFDVPQYDWQELYDLVSILYGGAENYFLIIDNPDKWTEILDDYTESNRTVVSPGNADQRPIGI